MKTLYDLVNIAILSAVGVFIGSSVSTWLDYRANPGLYAMWSAPWYSRIVTYGVFTAVSVAILLLLRWIIRKKLEKK